MSERAPAEIMGQAMAEHAGFAWKHCAREQWIGDARVALAAIREPTEAMLSAIGMYEIDTHGDPDFKKIWQQMIDAALLPVERDQLTSNINPQQEK